MCPIMQTKKTTFLCAQKRLKRKIRKQNKKDSIFMCPMMQTKNYISMCSKTSKKENT